MSVGMQPVLGVTVGVDTHRDNHVAAVVDPVGRCLGWKVFVASTAGYGALLHWAQRYGPVQRVGVEGTGSWGAGLTRALLAAGVEVVEVARPDRRDRRLRGKSDPLDAEAAARAALNGTASGQPKTRDGRVEAIRVLNCARSSALKSRTVALHQLRALVISAPAELRAQLDTLSAKRLVVVCARLRPTSTATAAAATKTALRSLARRCQALQAEVDELDAQLAPLVRTAGQALLALPGVGIHVAADLLVTAGDNPQRLGSEAAFAHLCGTAPLPASSGRTVRHRLNPGGDRRANRALYTVVLTRMRVDPRTRDYVARRTAEGLSKREIMRCLKRYVAREVHHLLTGKAGSAPDPALT